MRIVYQRCCGMDVHKDSVTACVLLIDEYGEWRSEKRKFRTMTRDLREMSAWLASLEVEAIAMEASGVYWKPVWNILEAENKFHLLLVNAHHIKQVPGTKNGPEGQRVDCRPATARFIEDEFCPAADHSAFA
jgi:transposase